jgi:molybdopterin synthase catalytic subunit
MPLAHANVTELFAQRITAISASNGLNVNALVVEEAAIATLQERVPVWKKEVWRRGAEQLGRGL